MSYSITNVSEQDTGNLKAVNINAGWTAFNTYWNPTQKGQFAKTYQLFGDVDGRLFERSSLSYETTFSRILMTDYSTYFVEYACKQNYGDFWTIEYIDIFTKDGLIASASVTLDDIKTEITSHAPNFDVSTLAEAHSADGCPYEAVWGVF